MKTRKRGGGLFNKAATVAPGKYINVLANNKPVKAPNQPPPGPAIPLEPLPLSARLGAMHTAAITARIRKERRDIERAYLQHGLPLPPPPVLNYTKEKYFTELNKRCEDAKKENPVDDEYLKSTCDLAKYPYLRETYYDFYKVIGSGEPHFEKKYKELFDISNVPRSGGYKRKSRKSRPKRY